MRLSFICLLVVFALGIVGPTAAQAATTEISASGTGSVSVPPNAATVNPSIETNAQSATDAIAENNARYDRIIAALTKLGIARGDIALTSYNVSYNPPPAVAPANPTGERYGYFVSRSFAVKVREIGLAGRVSDASIAAGATAINGVSFGLSDSSAARAQAIAEAVAAARKSAEMLARAAALRIVALKSIELASGEVAGPVPMVMARASAPTQFDQSNVNVRVTVSAVFLAEP